MSTPKTIEVLAPAGDEQTLRAAVFSGANAVYLGLKQFSARRSAANFSAQELQSAVAFCHARDVKVYVAINTTAHPDELCAVADCIAAVAAAGADALIVQDFAVARLAHQMAPALALHGSTQMSVHTLAGAQFLQQLGFSRVVLARELTGAEIEYIAKNTEIELEVFVHGALCVSVSGQCYMSAFLGGRSGNRGGCAGPCRLPFSADDSGEAHLSLKDLSAIKSLPALQKAGVVSAKIEGRLRTPEYVAAAVTACRQSLAGETHNETLLQDVFSRSGFTNAYIEGKINAAMFGVRTAEDSAKTKAALPAVRELFRRERQSVPVRYTVVCEAEGVKLTASDANGNAAFAYSETPLQPASQDQASAIERALQKSGGTPFYLDEIRFEGDAPAFLPGSEWNRMRRSVLETLLDKREVVLPLPCASAKLPAPANHPTSFTLPIWARFEQWEQVPIGEVKRLAGLIIPISETEKVPPSLRAKTILELPRAMFGKREAVVNNAIETSKKLGFKGYLVQNIAQLKLTLGLPVFGGFGLNITNQLAAESYAKWGLSAMTLLPELALTEMAQIAPNVPTWALVYGHMPLMMTRSCPLQHVTDCANCNKKGYLTDRKNRKFPVVCNGGVRQVYNPVPLYMGERQREMPVDAAVAYFTIESREQASRLLSFILSGHGHPGEFTRGLYYKSAQ